MPIDPIDELAARQIDDDTRLDAVEERLERAQKRADTTTGQIRIANDLIEKEQL